MVARLTAPERSDAAYKGRWRFTPPAFLFLEKMAAREIGATAALPLRVHAFQKPIGWNFPADASPLCFVIDRRANRGELQTDANIIQKTGDFPIAGPAFCLAGDEIL
jgi:hypothetical protein